MKIERRGLWDKLGNSVKRIEQWTKAARILGLDVTQSKGGTSHYSLRPANADRKDVRTVITTVFEYRNFVRRDVSEHAFKALRKHGIPEDDIWRALEMLD